MSFTALLLMSVVAGLQAAGQKTDVEQLNAAYRGKVLLLRGFYAGKEVDFDQKGAVMAGATAGSWTLANIQIAGIRATPQAVEITGDRLGVWFKGGKTEMVKAGKITVHLALPGSGTDQVSAAERLLPRIFVQPGENICPMLSEEWQVYCAGADPQAREHAWTDILIKKHLAPYNTALKPSSASKGRITAPAAEYTPDPSYTKVAKQHSIEGTVELRILLNDAGQASAVAVLQPLGLGLDEEAVEAVRHWRFRPAMQDRHPVPVQINVEMNFRCCP